MATFAAASISRAPGRRLDFTRPESIALAALAATFALQLYLAFAKGINWDEFYHFNLIHERLRGEHVQWLQTPFVWLFAWVPSLPGDSIAHIQLIRALMLPFELVTCAALYGIARRLAGRPAALFCTLAYATGGWVFLHAFALRADMIAAALLTSALWLALCRPVRPACLAVVALLVVLATIATIKSVLWAPAFLGAALLNWPGSFERRPRAPVVVAGVGLAALLGVAALAALAPQVLGAATGLARASSERMFSAGLFPEGNYLIMQIGFAPVLAVLIGLAIVTLPRLPLDRRRKVALACLMVPLLSVAVYRNAYPYFFAFILPPVVAAAAPAAERLIARFGLARLSLILLASAALLAGLEDRTVLRSQRDVVQGIHAIVPAPVAYIDESGMVADFPRAVPHFSTGWALAGYRARGVAEYSQALRQRPVPILLLNAHPLQNVFVDTGRDERLLKQDVALLRANYIPHWGLVFVAGKRIAPGARPTEIEIAVPGPYTVEGAEVTLNGRLHRPGEVIALDRGAVAVGGGRPAKTVLRWGDHLPRPARPWPEGPLFTDY